MSDNVFIDSSLWVDFFKRNPYSIDRTIKELLKKEFIYTNGIVISEIIAGSKSNESSITCCIDFLTICEMNYDFFIKAGQLIKKLKEHGKTIPLSDIYIACHCLEYNLKLLANDNHFKIISDFYPLKYEQIVSKKM